MIQLENKLEETLWGQFYAACLITGMSKKDASKAADEAVERYRGDVVRDNYRGY